MNLIVAFVINSMIAFVIPIVIYLFLLKPGFLKIKDFIIIPIVEIVVMLFLGISTSIMASKEKCDSYNGLVAFMNGIKLVLAVGITYAIVFVLPQLQFPFMKIAGPLATNPVMPYVAQGILLAASTFPATASLWMGSQKNGCVLNPEEVAKINRELAEDLNGDSPDPNEKPATVSMGN
jgi:Ca2+/H+ antiporter